MDFPLDHEMVIDILSSDFGPLVAQVGGYIFANGSRTLADIQRKAGLPKLVAKNCLCILLQHQLAVGTAHEWQGKVATKYKLILNNVYLRAAFPMLLVKIQKKYSENARLIVMGLMLNGIMSKSQILACVNENLPAEAVLPSIDNQDRTEFAFRELCTAFLLIRASKATASASLPAKGDTFPILGSMLPVIPPLPASSSTEATAAGMHKTKKKRGRKPNTPGTTSKKRRTKKEDEGSTKKTLEEEIRESISSIQTTSTTSTFYPGYGVPTESLQSEDDNSLWKLNFTQFLNDLRIDECTEIMSSRVNPVASEIIRILFSLSRNGSESVDLQVLRKALDNHPNPQVSHVSPADFQGYINFLAGEKYRILQKRLVPGKERQQLYHLNVPDLTHFLRDSLIASVVKSKFGPHAHRLFQLLISKKMLENSQLYHLSMLRLGETRLLLHSMMLQNYVQTQQIPKTAERNAQRSIWCWTVDFPTVLGVVTRECTFALRNFRMRLSNERDKAKPLVDKLMSGINLEPKLEQPQFEQYNVVKARMQSTIAGLIHDIIVLKML